MNDEEIQELKARRALWLTALSGKDRCSVMSQIGSMMWFTAAYEVVTTCRRRAAPGPRGELPLPWLLIELLDVCFFESQALAIRRLTTGNRRVASRKKVTERKWLPHLEM